MLPSLASSMSPRTLGPLGSVTSAGGARNDSTLTTFAVLRALRGKSRLHARAQRGQQQDGGQAPQAVENLHGNTADP